MSLTPTSGMKESPLISVITAVKNGAPYLEELIESVKAQDYPHFEHIIIDDGSDDDGATVSILQKYPHLRWWSRPNRGQYATQNEGISAAHGQILSVISADDSYIVPGTFSQVVNLWQTNSADDYLVYGKTLQMDANGNLLPYQVDITGAYPLRFLSSYLFIQHCSLFVSRGLIFDNDIWFDPSYKYAGDWDWIVRLTRAASSVGYLPLPLSQVRIHGDQTSRLAASKAIMEEHQRVCRSYGGRYLVHRLLKKMFQYRAMTMIALTTLRKGGVKDLVDLSSDWLRRKFIAG